MNREHPRFNEAYNIATVCHEANRQWCYLNGDESQKSWAESPEWQRESELNGVLYRMDNPGASKSALHDNWMNEKISEGWRYGRVKDAEKKTHPCLLPFNELPEFQQKKDALFAGIVDSLLNV